MITREYYDTDLLVIGSGAAASLAAIRADEKGTRALIVTKGPFGAGNTVMAPGGFEAAIGHGHPEDSPQAHFEDTMRAGGYINNARVVRAMTREMLQIPFDLDKWGCDLPKQEDGKFKQHVTSAITYPRVMDIRDETGKVLTRTFRQEIERRAIPILTHVMITRLLTSDEGVAGAVGYDYKNHKLLILRSKATVLAAGGGGHLFKITDNNPFMTGDGYALAYRAGAELVDMEMIEFQLTICNKNIGHRPAKTTQLLMRGGRLYNALGERFMKRINPRGIEKTTRANINRSVFIEIMEGRGTSEGGVYLDLSGIPDDELERVIPNIKKMFASKGIDLSWQPMRVYPGAHTFLGGVRIDEEGRSTVPRLFAAGEVAGGVHGANRLGGNALSAAMGYGSIAGRVAAEDCLNSRLLGIDEDQVAGEERRLASFLERSEGIEARQIKAGLQEIAHRNLNVARTESGLKEAIAAIEKLGTQVPRIYIAADDRLSHVWEGIEVENMLTVAELIARAALLRTESRGVHYRLDYPDTDDQWRKNIVIRLESNKPLLTIVPTVTD